MKIWWIPWFFLLDLLDLFSIYPQVEAEGVHGGSILSFTFNIIHVLPIFLASSKTEDHQICLGWAFLEYSNPLPVFVHGLISTSCSPSSSTCNDRWIFANPSEFSFKKRLRTLKISLRFLQFSKNGKYGIVASNYRNCK